MCTLARPFAEPRRLNRPPCVPWTRAMNLRSRQKSMHPARECECRVADWVLTHLPPSSVAGPRRNRRRFSEFCFIKQRQNHPPDWRAIRSSSAFRRIISNNTVSVGEPLPWCKGESDACECPCALGERIPVASRSVNSLPHHHWSRLKTSPGCPNPCPSWPCAGRHDNFCGLLAQQKRDPRVFVGRSGQSFNRLNSGSGMCRITSMIQRQNHGR